MVASSRRWALMHELRESPEPTLDELVAQMTPVDLLLVEGFKHHGHAKIEVHRPSLGKELLYLEDPWIVAVATDEPFAARCRCCRSATRLRSRLSFPIIWA